MRRALEKAARELELVQRAAAAPGGPDLGPAPAFEEAARRLEALTELVDEQLERLQQSVLRAAGVEPGRPKRGGGGEGGR